MDNEKLNELEERIKNVETVLRRIAKDEFGYLKDEYLWLNEKESET